MLRTIALIAAMTSAPLAFAQDYTTSTDAPAAEKRVSAGGLFVEPIITFSREDSKIKTSQLPIIQDDTSGTSQGVGVGARLGIHASEMIFVGLDGRYARTKTSDSSYGEADANNYTLAPTVGLQMPIAGLRVWGGYVVLGESNPEAGAQGFDVKFTEPQGARVGVGFHIGPVSVNVEYQDLQFNKTKIESYGLINATGTSGVDYESKGYTASLSFPMEL